MRRPVRVVERLAADRDQVGTARLQRLLRLLGREDQADRHGLDAGFLANAFGEGNLEPRHSRHQRLGRRGRRAEDAAGRAVDDIDAERLQLARKGDGVVEAPAAFHVIDRRDAREERPRRRPRLAHRARHLERKAHAVLARAAVLVGARIGERRKKGVQQVAVRGVDLDDVEARGHGAAHGIAESGEHRLEVARLEGAWRDPALAEARLGRRDGRPGLVAALEVCLRERAVAEPGTRHARLASGVRELDRRCRALALHELSDTRKARDVRIVPDAGIAVRDAPAALDRGGFHEYDAGAALRELAKVHEVPVAHMAVLRRVLAHRRYDDAVAHFQLAQRDRFE